MAEKSSEKPIYSLSENIRLGRVYEEAQRKNFDENNDEKKKMMMLIGFINENVEESFLIKYMNYRFNKVYNEDLDEDNPFVQQNQLNLEKYGKCLDYDES